MMVEINQFEPLSISFLEMKKNNIINGFFSKIIYGDSNITFNGIYIYFQLIPNHIISYTDNIFVKEPESNKNEYSFFYLDSNIFNSNISNKLSLIEYDIIEYYKELYKINKTSVYQLKTQLKTGNIKIYKNEKSNVSSKMNDSNDFTTNVIKSPQIAVHHYYTDTISNMSLKEGGGFRKEMKKYLLKISGIWENKSSVGITYKIIELGEIL
jgi:hypothetical protein